MPDTETALTMSAAQVAEDRDFYELALRLDGEDNPQCDRFCRWYAEATALRSELARLSRELELARRDSERLDWLVSMNDVALSWDSRGVHKVEDGCGRVIGTGPNTRDAIDAAMLAASAPRQETV